MTLAEHLSLCYDAQHGKATESPVPAFVQAIADDPALKAAAIARRAELDNPILVGKCYCSRVHRDILDDVLRRAA